VHPALRRVTQARYAEGEEADDGGQWECPEKPASGWLELPRDPEGKTEDGDYSRGRQRKSNFPHQGTHGDRIGHPGPGRESSAEAKTQHLSRHILGKEREAEGSEERASGSASPEQAEYGAPEGE